MNNQSKFYSRQIKLLGIDGQDGIIDSDRVDITNLHRQILYTPADIGEFKSVVSARKISDQNPNIVVSFISNKLDRQNVVEIFKAYDIIVDCTDNFKTKFLVHDACYSHHKKLVQASIYQYEGNLHVFDFSNQLNCEISPCLRCLWTKEPDDGCIGTCADVGVLGATAGVLGSLQAMEVSKLILGKSPLKNGEGLFVDLTTQDYEKRRWKKNNECPLCSEKAKNIETIQDITKDFNLNIDQVSEDYIWIDLRNKDEVEEFFIDRPKLIHMPLSEFNVSTLEAYNNYLLICQKGYRSGQMARALREMGHENYFSLVGGIQNFKK
jgi:molybdopterin/thiamine biosynthesis adenylyltransferase/rhodanese-related sulfurtransferase